MAGPVVDIFMVYMFLKRLVTPFDQTEAFRLGLIDAAGTRLKKAETPAEKAAMGYFDRLVFNLKRLLATVPGGSTRIASYAAALLLLREQNERLNSDSEYLKEEFIRTMNTLGDDDLRIVEEIAMSTGPGIAGTGGGQGGNPTSNPADWARRDAKKTKDNMLRRKKIFESARLSAKWWQQANKRRWPYSSKSSSAGGNGNGD